MSRSVFIILCISISLSYTHITIIRAAAQSKSDNLRYVSDVLVINIRDQLEKPYSVVGVVRSGDPVRVLEEQDNYYKIETADHKQGWIAKQYLKQEAPDTLVVQQLRQEVADLKKQLETAPSESAVSPGKDREQDSAEVCAGVQQKLNDAEKQIQQLQEQRKKQSANPGVSSESTQDPGGTAQLEETRQRYNQLIVEFERRGEEIAELQNSMAKQDDTTRFLWFGAGAVVFFLGILAGRSANRKKNKFLY